MKRTLTTLLICLFTSVTYAVNVFTESFEFANHDMTVPIGWTCDDQSWLCGYQDKDHNRIPHTGEWYAFTNADDAWMFMPIFLGTELRYHIDYWAISDGAYEVEFWAGSGTTPGEMTQLLFTANVNSSNYQQYSDYIESITADHRYFAIHAIASSGAYHLTIDDININMVNKYDLEVTPSTFDTYLMPGSQITIEYDVQNTGYMDLEIYMTPYTEYFSDIQFTSDGLSSSTFPTVAEQKVHCTCTATLLPSVPLGTRCWMDIMFTVSCDCVTRMATLWVNVGEDTSEVPEQEAMVKVYPNPAQGAVSIEGCGVLTVTNVLGQTLLSQWIEGKEDLNLPTGFYIVRLQNGDGVSIEKVVVE